MKLGQLIDKNEIVILFQVTAAINAVSNNATMINSGFMVNLPGSGVYPLLDRSYIGITTGQLGYTGVSGSTHLPDCDDLAAAIRFIKWLVDDSAGAPAPQIMIANYFVLQSPMNLWYLN